MHYHLSRNGLALACFWICAGLSFADREQSQKPVEYLLPRHRRPFFESAYFSRHRTHSLPHVNLLSPGAFDELFRARTFNNELIISCFQEDDYSLRWMHHFAQMAQALGFDHFVPIGHSKASCDAFRSSWCGGVGCNDSAALYPGCAFLDGDVDDGDPRWRDAKRVDPVPYLWMVRYHVAAEALRRGINVLLSDTDVAITSDFYGVVKRPPFADKNMFVMTVHPGPNGGLWYIQNAHPRGPLAHALSNAVHRMLAIASLWRQEPEERTRNGTSIRHRCSWVDQDALRDSLFSASRRLPSWTWPCLKSGEPLDERLWLEVFGSGMPVPQPTAAEPPDLGSGYLPFEPGVGTWGECTGKRAPLTVPEGWPELCNRTAARESEQCAEQPAAAWQCALCDKEAVGECQRLSMFAGSQAQCPRVMTVHPFSDLPLRHESDADVSREAAAAASASAPWAPSAMSTAGGWAVEASETVVLGPRYLMGDVRSMWLGWDQGPPRRAFSVLVHLVAFGKAWSKEALPDRNSREHLLQARGLWHGPVRQQRRVLRLSPALVQLALDEGQGSDDGPLRDLINVLALLAVVTLRTPVLPEVECARIGWLNAREEDDDSVGRFTVFGSDQWIPLRRTDGTLVCAPMISSGPDCNSDVVLSDFHFDAERFILPRGSAATVTLPVPPWQPPPSDRGGGGSQRRRQRLRQTRRSLLDGEGDDLQQQPCVYAPASEPEALICQLRETDSRRYGGTRTLWLQADDLGALLRVVKDAESVARVLDEDEKHALENFYARCPDYRPIDVDTIIRV